MKKILNLISAFYFSYSFIFNFNKKIILHFIYYLFFDIWYFILFDKNNIIKNDLIIHHINGIIGMYSNLILSYNKLINNDGMKINQLFALQEITTLIISLKGIYNDDEIKKFLNYILYILWIPIRILLPYYCIYNYYNYNYIENIYFKINQ